jgi:general secretion pathway protein C
MGGIMNKLYNLQQIITSAMPIFITFAVIKLLWSIADFTILPSKGVDISAYEHKASLYTPFKLARAVRKRRGKRKRLVNSTSLRMLTLAGVYRDNANLSKSIATISKGGTSKVVSIGDNVFGYILKEVGDDYASLEKDGKEYKLYLPKQTLEKSALRTSRRRPLLGRMGRRGGGGASGVIDNGDQKVVSRDVLNEYKKDMNKIWKNIRIVDYREGKKLKGFRVRFVKRGSFFEKLGLRRGDVIVGINGETVNSYSLPVKMLSNIDSMDGLILQIKRGNNEVELEYEIR